MFNVHEEFQKEWMIYLHGWVRDEDIRFLPLNNQNLGFAAWVLYPKPSMISWGKGEHVKINKVISAESIPYDFKLGFYRPNERQHGRQIEIGLIDLHHIE